ncbi:MAG TPA: hypothetical protein VMV62_02415 [Candidatus Paceibacterota bacterium]|nr:hypothetical protein [Candidatus Paceibacterota bacterium]
MNAHLPLGSLMKRMRSAPQVDPVRDWLIVIIIAAIALAGIIVWNAWAFDTVAGGGVIGSPAATTTPVFSQTSLDAVHAVFANRAAEEEKYLSGAYGYADPSL